MRLFRLFRLENRMDITVSVYLTCYQAYFSMLGGFGVYPEVTGWRLIVDAWGTVPIN